MKTFIVVVLIVLAGLAAATWVTTGELGFLPRRLFAEETQLRTLEKRFEAARRQVAAAGRAAGRTGAETSAALAAAQREVERLRGEVEAMLTRLHETAVQNAAETHAGASRRVARWRVKAQERAAKLKRALQAFERELR